MVKFNLRGVARCVALALIAGVIGSGITRIAFHYDPMVLATRQAIVDDAVLRNLIGVMDINDVSVLSILKTGDNSRHFAREEYTASVKGSRHGALVKVLIKKSYLDGKSLGDPEIIDIRVRN